MNIVFDRPETDYAWAAGFIDGEGWIAFHRTKSGPKTGCGHFVLAVAQVDRRPLQKLGDLFGGNVNGPYQHKNRETRQKPWFKWELHGSSAKAALDRVFPYLVFKREQFLRAREEHEKYLKEPRRPRRRRTHCKKGHEFTAETTGLQGGRRICRICNRAYQSERRAIQSRQQSDVSC